MKKNIIKFKGLGIIILILLSNSIKAQFDAIYTQYMFNETFINPAYVGNKEAMDLTLLHRQQWTAFGGHPVTTAFSIHGPLSQSKMGLGLSILNDQIGVLNRNLVYLNYAYRIKLSEKGVLALGLMGGIDNQTNKFSSLAINENGVNDDPQLAKNGNMIAPNFGTGLFFNNKKFYAGISMPRMIDNQVSFNNLESVTTTKVDFAKFTYHITCGNMFTLNESIKLKASGMLKIVQNAPMQFDLNANFLFEETLWAGLSYRTGSAISALAGIQINKQFLICYSYDYGLNGTQKYFTGSNEIILNYLFSFKGKQVITPRYF